MSEIVFIRKTSAHGFPTFNWRLVTEVLGLPLQASGDENLAYCVGLNILKYPLVGYKWHLEVASLLLGH